MKNDKSVAFSSEEAGQFLEQIKKGEISNDTIMKTFQEIPEGFPTNEKYTEIVSAIQINYPSIYRQVIEKDI